MNSRLFKQKKPSPLLTCGFDNYQLWQYAMLANAVYTLPTNVGTPITDMYQLYNKSDLPPTAPRVGYQGAFFAEQIWPGEEKEGPHGFVIAARGTEFDQELSRNNAIEVALNTIPHQVPKAIDYMNRELSIIQNLYRKNEKTDEKKKEYWNKKSVIFTGHSLGAIIACCQYATYCLEHPTNKAKCFTYENPGAFTIVKHYLETNHGMSAEDAKAFLHKLEKHVVNIQGDVNIINTCNKQWGETLRLKVPYDFELDPKPMIPIAPFALNNFHYILSYSFGNQHKIVKIIEQLDWKKGNTILENADAYWPHGFQEGYRFYLSPSKREDYWKAYFKHIWDEEPSLHHDYQNNENKFITAMMNKNAILANEVRSSVKMKK